jgi:hypothetical protein
VGGIAFFVAGHPDDWQLFMNPNASNELADPDRRVAFLYLTAGDSGKDATYWAAREEGAKASVRFRLTPLGRTNEASGSRAFGGRPIHFWSCGNSISYFLRLPDGFHDGSGSPRYGKRTLARLRRGKSTLQTVGGSVSYDTWADLRATVKEIIISESGGLQYRCINLLDTDESINPGDHSDHWHTGQLIEESFLGNSDYRLVSFVGYSLPCAADDLIGAEAFWKAGMFAAYEKAVYDATGHSTIAESQKYLTWCVKQTRSRQRQ